MNAYITILTPSGTTRQVVPLTAQAKRVFSLMNEDYISLPFTLKSPVRFEPGDYVRFTDDDGDPRLDTFTLTETVSPRQGERGGYDYELKMEAYYMAWRNKLLKLSPATGGNESSFTVTAGITTHLDRVTDNLAAIGLTHNGAPYVYVVTDSATDTEKHVTITYDGVSILEAIGRIAEAFNAEWWIIGNTIFIGRCEYDSGFYTLEAGANVATMTPDNNLEAGTRFYFFGSDRNLPRSYRSGATPAESVGTVTHRRLCLPADTPYIDADPTDTNTAAKVERVVTLEDIYPRIDLTVSAVATKLYEDQETDDNGETLRKTWTAYCIQTADIDYITDYDIDGQEQTVKFESGTLNGFTFNRLYNSPGAGGLQTKDPTWDDGRYFFELERLTDPQTIPNEVLHPKAGDKFVIFGWDSSKIEDLGLISDAERRLKEAGEKYIAERNKMAKNFRVCLLPRFVYGEDEQGNLNANLRPAISAGDRVTLINPAYFKDGRINSRIIGFTYPLFNPADGFELTIGETNVKSTLGEIKTSIDSLITATEAYKQQASGSTLKIITTGDTTPFSDRNVLSALRTRRQYLDKERAETVNARDTFAAGLVADDVEVSGDTGVHSPNFEDGFGGSGYRLWLEDSLARLTIDRLTVRRVMTVYELLIGRVKSVGGQICVSAANGKIKTVTSQAGRYIITFETECMFRVGDLVRCQTFTGGALKYYWVEVASLSAGGIAVYADEFEGARPEPGDECVLMGSTTDKERQNIVLISAAGDGAPRIDVLDGISKKDTMGCLRARFGCLDGIIESQYAEYLKPQGYGLYADNAFLRGTFMLTTGEDILTKFQITEGKIESAVTGLDSESTAADNILRNGSFTEGLSWWIVPSSASALTYAGRALLNDGSTLTTDGGNGAILLTDEGRRVVQLSNCLLVQPGGYMARVPNVLPDASGVLHPVAVRLTFLCRALERTDIVASFSNEDKTGFEAFEPLYVRKTLPASDKYEAVEITGLWSGSGDFNLFIAGKVRIRALALRLDGAESMEVKYQTLFEQTDRLIKMTAAVYDKDGQALNETGLVLRPEGGGIYAIGSNGLAAIGATVTEDGKALVALTGDEIRLSGSVTANGKFSIRDDGSISCADAEMDNAIITGFVRKRKTVVTAANIAGYINREESDPLQPEKRLNIPRIDLLGGWVSFEDDANGAHLPDDYRTLYFPRRTYLNNPADTTAAVRLDYARSMVGNSIMVYNNQSGVNALTARLTLQNLIGPNGTVQQVVLPCGYMLTAECRLTGGAGGTEQIGWHYTGRYRTSADADPDYTPAISLRLTSQPYSLRGNVSTPVTFTLRATTEAGEPYTLTSPMPELQGVFEGATTEKRAMLQTADGVYTLTANVTLGSLGTVVSDRTYTVQVSEGGTLLTAICTVRADLSTKPLAEE